MNTVFGHHVATEVARDSMTGERSRKKAGRSTGDPTGRERLLVATRERMRERPPVKLHRRSIADAAGVAPGLVTYYFPQEPMLIEAAARPIINGYLERLKAVLIEASGLDASLRALVDLLLEIARVDGPLLDTYIRYMKEQDVPHKQDILVGSYTLIDALIRRGVQSGHFGPVNTAFASTALWGICRTMAQTPELSAMLAAGQDRDASSILAEMIVDFLLRALKPDGEATAGVP